MYLINKNDAKPYMEQDYFNYFDNYGKSHSGDYSWDLLGYFPCSSSDFKFISTHTTKGDVIPVYIFNGGKGYYDQDLDEIFCFDDMSEDWKNPSKRMLENHWIIMFLGCDNASYGMRFKEKTDAIKFLDTLNHVDFAEFFRAAKLERRELMYWNS